MEEQGSAAADKEAARKERRRQSVRDYHARNRDKLAERMREWRAKNPGRNKATARAHHLRYPWKGSLRAARRRATERGLPFNLTDRYVESIWTGRCALTDMPFVVGSGKLLPLSPSLDRVVPELGYVEGNVRFIAHAINAMKLNGSDDQMYELAEALLANRPKQEARLKLVA